MITPRHRLSWRPRYSQVAANEGGAEDRRPAPRRSIEAIGLIGD